MRKQFKQKSSLIERLLYDLYGLVANEKHGSYTFTTRIPHTVKNMDSGK